jgi:SWI/SNF-related matrix-associated actin-dependent regulator 1 of chromatin subfamily A
MKISFEPKTKALPHQLEAISFLSNSGDVALFDEQGVGKTKEVIDALIILLKEGKIDSALIVCPKTLMYTWESEIKKHSYLVSSVLEGNNTEKGYRYLSSPNIYIINYEGIKSELEIIKLLLQTKRFAIVLDESQRIKQPKTQTFQSLVQIKDYATKRIILTGTPVANNITDLWAQFYFLDSGKTLGTNYSSFTDKYNTSNITTETLNAIYKSIAPRSIRRLKENVLELPEKIYISEFVDLKPKQQEIYKQLKEELLIEILKTDERTIIDESKSILKKLLRLVQIASNPGLVVLDYKETPAKFECLDDILRSVLDKGEKIIIWSSFVGNVKTIKNRYKKYGSLCIYGDIPISDRSKFIELFQNDQDYKVLVANPAAAREGITLTAANNAVYLDRSFNLVDYLQSQDRIHRISQTKKCNIIKLIANDTIDLFVEDKLKRKQDIARVAQGDKGQLDSEDTYLTKEEIIELLK